MTGPAAKESPCARRPHDAALVWIVGAASAGSRPVGHGGVAPAPGEESQIVSAGVASARAHKQHTRRARTDGERPGLGLGRSGSHVGTTVWGAVTRTPQTLRAKAWRYLRIKKKATLEDILSIVADGVEKDAAGQLRRYLGALASVGVLIRVRSSWLLPEDRNTGPEAPALNTRTRTVTDVNTGEKWTLG